MINLLFTCIASFLTFLPFAAKDNNVDFVNGSENVLVVDELQSKYAFVDNNYVYIGFVEFVTYDNFLSFTRYIKQFEYFPMSNVTVANFLLGQTVHIDLNGVYDVSVGDFTDGEFIVNTNGTSTLEYIEFSYDGSLDYYKEFAVSFKYSNRLCIAKGFYNFSENNDSSPICNYSLRYNNVLVSYERAALKFNLNQFGNLLGGYSQTLNNYDLGYADGVSYGYQKGYAEGYIDADNTDSVANSIFTGIFEVGLLPVNVFLTIFNFEVFGINISGIVSGLLTMAVVVIIVRFLLGGKNDD